MSETVVQIINERGRARVTLSRPQVRNAFDAELIARLTAAFTLLGSDPAVRAIVLAGEGTVFCGGADVNWMRDSLTLTREENVADAQAMSDMFRAIDRCPKPVIARVAGAALGGGAGLCAVCDIVVAERAQAIGLVHEIVDAAALDEAVETIARECESAGPAAIAAAKQLIRDVRATSYDATRELTAAAIADARTSAEGQEGLRAFLERRAPAWVRT